MLNQTFHSIKSLLEIEPRTAEEISRVLGKPKGNVILILKISGWAVFDRETGFWRIKD